MGNVLAAFRLREIARFQQHLKQCTQGLTLEAIFIYNIYYRGLLKPGSMHVPSMNFKSGRFAYWWGGYVAVSILQYCNCDSSCHCCRFNPSSCCLSPFIHWWIPEGPGPAMSPTPPHSLIPRSARLPPPLIWRSGSATVICLMLLFLGQVTCQNFTLTWPHYIQYFLPIILLLLWLQFLLSKFTGSWDLSKLNRAFHVVQSDDLFT